MVGNETTGPRVVSQPDGGSRHAHYEGSGHGRIAVGDGHVGGGGPSDGVFVTSVGMGNGGDLGGVAGADAHCAMLAKAAGSSGRTWRAYLSTQAAGDEKRGKSARDRIGAGPWYNARGELIASDLDQLHLSPNIVKRTAVDENGNRVNGRGDKPNRHDILTGSKDDGTAYFPWEKGDHTCQQLDQLRRGQRPGRAS